jgi:NitT/TauT family transport system ATP-binding protein
MTSASAPIVDLRNVVKSFAGKAQRDVTVIENVNLNISAGKFATVVGPSGCGKSTLLMMIGGLVKPTSGEVRVAGDIIARPRPDRIGMVFQDATLLPWKTALGNVEFPLQLSGVNENSRHQRARELLDLVGLKSFMDHFPHELSGGMRQRVGIARGLACDPAILLMDEPFSALDEQNRTKMGQELLRIWEATRKTVLFITHSLTEAVYLSDVIFVMRSSPGRIVETIEVDFPRPRLIDVIDTPEFGRIRNHIWHLVAGPVT